MTTGSDDISITGDVTTTSTSTVGTTGMQAETSGTTLTREMTSESEPVTTELEVVQLSTVQEQEATSVVTSSSSVETSTSQPEVGETTSAERGDVTDYPRAVTSSVIRERSIEPEVRACSGECACYCPPPPSPQISAHRPPTIPWNEPLLRHYQVRDVKPLNLPSDLLPQPDSRTSAVAMGTAAIIVMVVFFLGFLFIDANSLLRDLKMLKQNLKSCIRFCFELKQRLVVNT